MSVHSSLYRLKMAIINKVSYLTRQPKQWENSGWIVGPPDCSGQDDAQVTFGDEVFVKVLLVPVMYFGFKFAAIPCLSATPSAFIIVVYTINVKLPCWHVRVVQSTPVLPSIFTSAQIQVLRLFSYTCIAKSQQTSYLRLVLLLRLRGSLVIVSSFWLRCPDEEKELWFR